MSDAAPEPKANQGAPEPRYEARSKVTGEARFASDFPVLNPAYAYLVTSAIAKGRIDKMNIDDASATPGLIDILTSENTDEITQVKFGSGGGGASSSIQKLGPEIFHDGQIIAMVLAESFEAAREAAARVDVTYAESQPSLTFGSEGVTEDDLTAVSEQYKELPKGGDIESALGNADVTIDVNYETPPQHHNAMELFTTTCAWNNGRLTIYEPSQFVYGMKNNIAKAIEVEPANVDVISPLVGGAFGSKAQLTARTALVALAAKRLNRPVKLVATRDQGFTIATYRAETKHHIRMGASRNGKLVGFNHEGWEVTSRPDPYAVAGVEDSTRLYAYGAVGAKVTLVHADRNTPGFMRSPPVVPYIYALESAMDEMAVKLGMDPVEFRRINDTTTDPVSGKPYSSRSLMKCYDEAAAAFGWNRRNPAPGSMRDGDWLIGWGCATAVYPTHVGPATARVRMLPSGDVRVQTAAHDIGTGAYTIIGQLAAEKLGVPVSSVTVELGDSRLPPAPVAGGSNTTASVCSAVIKACDAIGQKLMQAAAASGSGQNNPTPSDIKLDNGQARFRANNTSESYPDLFKRLGVGAIEEYVEFVPEGMDASAIEALYKGNAMLGGGSKGPKLMYATGAEFVEVRINEHTREIRTPRMVGAFAAGRIMNTRTAHSQLMGGMIWGVSSALHEGTEIDEKRARYVNDNLADYLIPVNADIQQVKIIMVPEVDNEVNPAGVKGLGELANVGTAAAIANAVYHATGIRIRKLPIRIEDILQA